MLLIMDLAGISRAHAPWLRSRAKEIAEAPPEQHQPTARLITYQGQTHGLTEWATLININVSTLCHRLRRGWSVTRALSTPGRH